ncbi:hypothetical protein FKP32DRAFT_1591896 [Trametes sanguinea]|nr:hypothetical protein FKP32DRAFT_1591896 [Trametes sanguinea]
MLRIHSPNLQLLGAPVVAHRFAYVDQPSLAAKKTGLGLRLSCTCLGFVFRFVWSLEHALPRSYRLRIDFRKLCNNLETSTTYQPHRADKSCCSLWPHSNHHNWSRIWTEEQLFWSTVLKSHVDRDDLVVNDQNMTCDMQPDFRSGGPVRLRALNSEVHIAP